MKASKAQLIKAIEAVNKRYAKGLNDDDQVTRMVAVEKAVRGYSFIPRWDYFEIATEYEAFKHFADKHGYWSDCIKERNERLKMKGGYEYMKSINDRYLAEHKNLCKP